MKQRIMVGYSYLTKKFYAGKAKQIGNSDTIEMSETGREDVTSQIFSTLFAIVKDFQSAGNTTKPFQIVAPDGSTLTITYQEK